MGKEGTTEHDSYLIQCIRLGMLIADPTELDTVEPWHFGDPVLRDVVSELKERKAAKKRTNGPKLLTTYLVELGCEDGAKSVEDAKSAIRDRVEALGGFKRAVEFLGAIVQTHIDLKCGYSNAELRKFAESVGKGMEPRT